MARLIQVCKRIISHLIIPQQPQIFHELDKNFCYTIRFVQYNLNSEILHFPASVHLHKIFTDDWSDTDQTEKKHIPTHTRALKDKKIALRQTEMEW